MQSDAIPEDLRDPLSVQLSPPRSPLFSSGDLICIADQVRQALLLPDVLQETAVVRGEAVTDQHAREILPQTFPDFHVRVPQVGAEHHGVRTAEGAHPGVSGRRSASRCRRDARTVRVAPVSVVHRRGQTRRCRQPQAAGRLA